MLVCEFTIAIVGTVNEAASAANICMIVFTCCYIFCFASTWGPAGWVSLQTLSLHIHLYMHMNPNTNILRPKKTGRDRRNLPSTHKIQIRSSLHGLQLALELRHRLHNSVHGRRQPGKSQGKSLLRLGFHMHLVRGLRVFFGSRDEGA